MASTSRPYRLGACGNSNTGALGRFSSGESDKPWLVRERNAVYARLSGAEGQKGGLGVSLGPFAAGWHRLTASS